MIITNYFYFNLFQYLFSKLTKSSIIFIGFLNTFCKILNESL